MELEQNKLDAMDRHYDQMFESFSRRLEESFDELDKAEKRLADAEARLESVRKQALTKDSTRRGTTVKTIHFRFPVSYNGEAVYEISLPKENTV